MAKLKNDPPVNIIEQFKRLMDRPEVDRNLPWLESALQAAVRLEFATVPAYLSALWSIKDQAHPVAASIRNVVQEEMLHMALACNMLTAIGCVPKINDPDSIPSYPGKLPHNVETDLTVSLSGLTQDSLDKFIRIEEPTEVAEKDKELNDEKFPSIGRFYDAISACFDDLTPPPVIHPDRQVSGPLAYMVFHDLRGIRRGIDLIKHQGEGAERTPLVDGTDELAHYYRFKEIQKGHRIVGLDKKHNPIYGDERLEWPDTWPVAVVPKGGYARDDVSEEVWSSLRAFDLTWTRLLNLLQATWEHGDQASLVHAIETMFALAGHAREVMQIEIAPGKGNYGPCFRYLGPGKARQDE
jgi:hypothetical protein